MMIPRPDLLDPASPREVEVFQVTGGPGPSNMLYPDQPTFLEGGAYVYRSDGEPHIADPANGFAGFPLFDAPARRTAVLAAPDGRHVMYLEPLDQRDGPIAWRQVNIHTRRVETLMVVDALPGAGLRRIGGMGTVSGDGRRMALLVFLGDGETPNAPFGILVLDRDEGGPRLIFEHPEIPSAHLVYCRAPDPDAGHDLLVQMAHGCRTDEKGRPLRHLGPPSDRGVDIHVIRDDGTRWRDLPWGRDGHESCIGHQFWRGTGTSAVGILLENNDTTYGRDPQARQKIVEGWPVPARVDGEHLGVLHPGARRRVLSEGAGEARFCHLYVTPDGNRFAFDTFDHADYGRQGMRIYAGHLPDDEGTLRLTYLLNSGTSVEGSHAHPVVSPDGRWVYFNSDITGRREIYAVRGPGLGLPVD